ncbi:hypothetical protein WBG06_08925 [Nocardioides sp. CCNWLW239]|uniref:hypothetical protein n=1 Tax=Nocardioides sp. CCNWLW239 TaxID=3128902 RepID=UPI003018A973
MLRKISLAAAVLALAAAGLTIGTSSPAAAASTPSVRATTACEGGAGTITVGSYRRATGGTTGTTRLEGVKRPNWMGYTQVGLAEPAFPVAEGEEEAPPMLKAVNGVVRDSTSSKLSWPRPVNGFYLSRDAAVMCMAGVRQTSTFVEGMSMYTTLRVRRDSGVVRVEGMANRYGKHKVIVRLWSPAGYQQKTKYVNPGYDSDIGVLSARFTGFKRTNKFTKAVVIVKHVKTGRTTRLAIGRTL